ncbi:efflux RND transporter periplasmic adaptor subunit [Gilvimarinus sp. SDUM040013]|uniref:Efflux RND transporter periplasmic adaptor subunit n=1 Tax=Gilvimarinus gilvus TaxID=3058038 RepID=A0ABU4RZP9_9GAMM|nr:efflux RND transporter periplasmic adaptor subunit [Gilvimarinus sp. SDUM040013]MDO3386082.1 efflux RND transporter periplasmic adaptor subunit [Gilvimarinus sp. SDUM040013]MDX6850377.1 efflux RND transporter periplasmic adaptor subunit [Gilvimarinus sp. SDUM040013]
MFGKYFSVAFIASVIGLCGGYFFAAQLDASKENPSTAPTRASAEPLYWVAPMDATFRRDAPGQSPMGMDLVPVYADDVAADEADVQISPSVVQQLGVTTAQARARALNPQIKAAGFVSFNKQTLAHFHLRATGWISNLSVNAVGDPVAPGQKLFDFYSPDIRNTQQEFLQALSSGNNGLIRASKAKLVAQGVPASEIADLAKTRQIKSAIAYYAQSSGVVAELNVANGSYVSLEQNTLSIGPLSNVWVIAEVFERQAGLLSGGLNVEIRSRAYPGRSWQGTIDYVYPVINPANRTTRARIVVTNTDLSLRPNMLAEVFIDTDRQDVHLSVPENAVIRTGRGDRVVREVAPGVFRSTVVATGISANGYTEVIAGLGNGDTVVTNAQFLIDSESSIHIELERLSQPADKTMNHSQMNRSEIDHAAMDHSQMNHSQHKEDNGGEL